MDAHIGTTMMLKKVSKQCKEAWTLVENAKIMPNKKHDEYIRKNRDGEEFRRGCYGKREDPADKENAMLKVLELMSQRI